MILGLSSADGGMMCMSNLFSDDNRKIPGYDRNSSLRFGSRERHSKLTEKMHVPLRPILKEDTLRR